MQLNLKNRCALITGGSRGIGRAIALQLAEEGCNIAICARDESKNKEAIEEITTRGYYSRIKELEYKYVAKPCDVLNPKQISDTLSQIVYYFGDRLDILINNVGGGGRWGNEQIEDTELRTWQEVLQKNLLAAIQFTTLAIPYMKKNKWGRVITISSIYGYEAGGRPWFNIAKAAEIALMKNLSLNHELARKHLTFNTIAPGNIYIPGTGWDKEIKDSPEKHAQFVNTIPAGAMGKPGDIANIVTFLCSDRASYINGACIIVDGGVSKRF